MFKKPLDFVAIGDITTDAFIRLKDAAVHCKLNNEDCELCVRFGDKIPFEYVKVVKAVGNSANAAVSAARLGLRSALIANIGNDQNGKDCVTELQRNKVVTSLITTHKSKPTNYHFVLWFEADRTILVNHTEYDYVLPDFAPPKWLYVSSMAANTEAYHKQIVDYIEKHPNVRLAFQPGTYQMKLGFDKLAGIYKRTDVYVVNFEEAVRILGAERGDAWVAEIGTQPRAKAVKELLKGLRDHGPKLIIITDNTDGAYFFDGDHYYHVPMYPDPRPAFERTGCGDAFASTFVAALAMGKTPLEALIWAPVNPMSVAQFIGAQEGLLSLDQLEWWLHRAPQEYKVTEI